MKMKKVVAAALAAMCVVSMAACGSEKKEVNSFNSG